MLQPVSVGLKFGFLIVLFLFLFWVATSAAVRPAPTQPRRAASARTWRVDETGWYSTADALAELDERVRTATVGRTRLGTSSRARLRPDRSALPSVAATWRSASRILSPRLGTREITRQGRILVIEDLGSTNGTYLNDEPLNGPQPLHDGDRIRIGDSEFSYYQ